MPRSTSGHPKLIRISHTDRHGTVAVGDLSGATAVFRSAGWVRRPSSWVVASSAGRPVRSRFIHAVAARLEGLGFVCELSGVDELSTGDDADACASDRHAALTRDHVKRSISSLSPAAVQERVDTLQSKSTLSTQQAIELECLLDARARQIAAGERLDLSQSSVRRGDRVRVDHHWGTVIRANRRWVAVERDSGGTTRVRYATITEHQAF